MDKRSRAALLCLVLGQAVHSAEEYVFQFYAIFPPARYLDQLVPGIVRPGFIAFNAALIAFGVGCWLYAVRPARPGARTLAWFWVIIELYNGLAHVAWAILIGGYNPGLYTAPLMATLAGYLGVRLWTEESRVSCAMQSGAEPDTRRTHRVA